ncbi:Anaphase-promoting complex subunit 2 [Plasmodiophora brassicae]|uniref:Anaphase-promoting complex subunit 2 n=1 Tax=Plasmodiophora brassicae TaxID=37360 RepID=A0A0G4IJJ3_PLABS|nr:hypothetical protein PBRA_004105 [Plasmodiophora brassicae]
MSAETTKRARLFEEYPGERYDVDPFAVLVANAGVGGDERMARHAASAIRAQRQSALFVDWYFYNVQETILAVAEQWFWASLEPIASASVPSAIIDAICMALDSCLTHLHPLLYAVQTIHQLLVDPSAANETAFVQNGIKRFYDLMHSIFFSAKPDWFHPLLVAFFSAEFDAWDVAQDMHVGDRFRSHVCRQLHELQWMAIFESGYITALLEKIEERIQSRAAGQYLEPVLPEMLLWLETSVLPWVSFLHGTDSASFQQCVTRLTFVLYEQLGELRIGELFDIIADFPDSQPAVVDLSQCIAKADQQMLLIKSLREAFQRRLLHPGANTRDIVSQFVSCLRVLQLLDPSGVTLSLVAGPVCEYLRSRPDSVRVILTALTDASEPHGLLSELEKSARSSSLSSTTRAQVDEDEPADVEWQPEPIAPCNDRISPVTSVTSTCTSYDVLSQLASIHGQPDNLVDEFKGLLAERLMALRNYDTDVEVHYLELFKQRFGESHFHGANVMISDISLSKRINTNIHKTLNREANFLNGTIISREFWPHLSEDASEGGLLLPRIIVEAMTEYSKHYEVLKAPRELIWKPHLGSSDLQLTFLDGRTVRVSDVTPEHAAVLFAFESMPTDRCVTVDELCAGTRMTMHSVRRRLQFWVQKRILRQSGPNEFCVNEHAADDESHATYDSVIICDEDDDRGGTNAFSAETQQRESAKLLESYILGILPSSFGGFTLSRIHSILRSAFVSGSTNYNRSEAELHEVLERLVQEKKLQCLDGLYKQCSKPMQ